MKKLLLLVSAIFFCFYSSLQGQESPKNLTHTAGNLSISVWNNGFFGQHHEPSLPGSFSWKGINGAFGASCCFGTKKAGSVSGIAGFGAYFLDMENVTSNFANGFTEETVGIVTFDQVTTAVIRDDKATDPYGFDVIQKSYSISGKNVVFIRNGYINTTVSPIIDLYSEIGGDLDIGNHEANGGGVDTNFNLVYINEPGTNNPYFGFAALDNLSGCKVGTSIFSNSTALRKALFAMISTLNLNSPNVGDQRAVLGSFVGEIPVGDTAWITFAILAGDNLEGIKVNAANAFEIAYDAGWTDKIVSIYTGDQIINVPNDYATIQEAIDSSEDGDTVLVADGTYYENINFRGKAITLTSHFLMDGDKAHIDNTVIDGSQPDDPNKGTVVHFRSGEDDRSVLYGFTITGGTGGPDPYGYGTKGAGGIAITNSGATIQHNKITANIITHNKDAHGGGIIINATSKKVLILDNYITNNKVLTSASNGGGGSGIFIYNCDGDNITIAKNVISDNVVSTTNGTHTGYGGGIFLKESAAQIRNNLIKNNGAAYGGGISLEDYPSNDLDDFLNNSIVNNEALYKGGGVHVNLLSLAPKMTNSIFWANTAPTEPQLNSRVLTEYSDVQGGFTGTGNIDLDPLFEDTVDYYLSSSSPCVDTGSPDSIYNDIQDKDNSSYPLFPALGELRNDMGHCGGDPFFDRLTDVKLENAVIPTAFTLKQNYPNPFNPTTTIKYSIPTRVKSEKSNVKNVNLTVHDVLGKEVAILVNEKQNPGNYTLEWNANNNSSGVYFYTLQAGDFIKTKKMILVK